MNARNQSPDRATDGAVTVRRMAKASELKRADIVRAVRAALGSCRIAAVNVALADEATLTELHRRFLGDSTPTDVITFDLREDPNSDSVEGEIVVSVDCARSQAARRGLPLREELLRYIIHGALHLAGLDDATAAGRRRMRREEDRVLIELGAARPGKARR